jgi:hypothetical protein
MTEPLDTGTPSVPIESLTLTLPPESKALLHSRTFWLNLVSFLVLALGLILDQADVFHLSTALIAAGGILVAVLNAVLRLYTNRPIAGSPGEEHLAHDVMEPH